MYYNLRTNIFNSITIKSATFKSETYRVIPENGSLGYLCTVWDRWIMLIKRVYTEGTAFMKPTVSKL